MTLLLGACDTRTESSSASRDGPLAAWTLAETPEFLTPSEALSDDPTGFFRVTAGVLTEDGGAVVAVGGNQSRVLYLGPRGEVDERVGGEGAAVELGGVASLFAVGDNLAVWDAQKSRVALLRDRTIEEVIPLRIPSRHAVVGVFPDGTIVTTRSAAFAVFATADSAVQPDTPTVYDLWDRRGNRAGTLEGPPSLAAPYFRFVHRREGSEIFSTDVHGGTCLPEIRQIVQAERILIADAAEGALYALDRSGRMTELMRTPERGTVTAGAVERVQEMIESTESYVEPVLDDAERTMRAQLGDAGDPLPSAWSALGEDRADGSIWLRRAACFPEDPTEVWDVVDGEGRRSATVTVPGNLRILSVVGDRVLAVVRDGPEPERVAVFQVRK